LFNQCKSLKKVNISNFNIGKLEDSACMFFGCSSLEEIYVPNDQVNIDPFFKGTYEMRTKIKRLNYGNYNK